MSDKTLIEWNADVGTRFLTIHPDGSFDIDKDAPPLFVIGELAKAFIRQQDRIKRLEEDSDRLHWLLKRGLAWRGCYNGHWLEGEWLYSSQYAIETIDKAKEAKP